MKMISLVGNRGFPIFFVLICAATGIFTAWEFTCDDAYITFRYSKHLGNGQGLTWNIVKPSVVEGYSNFSWMLLMAIPERVGISADVFAKIFGGASLVLCCFILYHYCMARTGNHWAGVFCALGFLSLPSTYFHAVSGLETLFYSLIILGIYITCIEIAYFRSNVVLLIYILPLLTLLAGATRPEGLLPGTLGMGLVWCKLRGRERRLFLLSCAFLFLLPGVIYFGWRMWYFANLFPNPFYVKVGDFSTGLIWALHSTKILVPCLGVILLAAYISVDHAVLRGWPVKFFFAFVVATLIPYAISRLMMDYAHRFLYHALPVIILTLGFSVDHLLCRTEHRGKTALKCILFVVLLPTWSLIMSPVYLGYLGMYGHNLNACHAYFGKLLRDSSVSPPHRLLAVGDAGAIPYYSDWDTLDFVGLNDTYIAHLKDPTSRVLQVRPSMILLYSKDDVNLRAHNYGLDVSRIMDRGYSFVGSIKFNPNYYLFVYVKDSLPCAEKRIMNQVVGDASEFSRANTKPPTLREFVKRTFIRLRHAFDGAG